MTNDEIVKARAQARVIRKIVVDIRRFIAQSGKKFNTKPKLLLTGAPEWIADHLPVICHLTKADITLCHTPANKT
jgi:hypothetical protein